MDVRQCSSHKDLVLWQKSLALAIDIQRATASFPRSELYGLVGQMRRAAVSIPSNIAEGAARRTTKDFTAFLHIARGSLAELETQLIIAESVGYLGTAASQELTSKADEISRILTGLLAALRRRSAPVS
jgi:four helix bundle protein